MSLSAKCKDCAHARWTLTPSGRVKRSVSGRCGAEVPPKPVYLWRQAPPSPPVPQIHRRIWLDYEGQCDLFTKKEPTT